MPQLPLPPIGQGVPIADGDLPVSSSADVSAEWSQDIQTSPTAPVRDAIQAGETAMFLEYQRRASYAAAQSDPLRATGEYLDEIGSYERGIDRQGGESDTSYSTRVNSTPAVVDVVDILAAVDALLAPYTSILARYFEHNDGMFLGSGATTWSCHLFGLGTDQRNAPPNYPDRLYPECTPAGLTPLPNRRPGGACLFPDAYGRIFEIRVPDISAIDSHVAAIYDGTETDTVTINGAVYQDGFFLGSGTNVNDLNISFLWSIDATSFDIYNSIVSAVERLRGMSIRWILLADPKLTS